MISRRRWFILALALAAAIGLPYLFAYLAAGKDFVFVGFLLNIPDGNSYLAKMVEGWNGSWVFTLPYAADPGQGAYIFSFYLFLGHLARWLGLPLMLVYHGVRILCSLLMLAAMGKFMLTFVGEKRGAWPALVWAAFGSGLGWTLLLFGLLTADTWVTDAFPFLSAFAIPHFALSLAIVLWLFSNTWRSPGDRTEALSWRNITLNVVAALVLSEISPFSVIIVLVMRGADALLSLWLYRRQYWQEKNWLDLVWIGLGGSPILIYQFWVTQTDPVLAVWTAQNQTPSPAPWDLLISFSPALLIAFWGAWVIIRNLAGGRVKENSGTSLEEGKIPDSPSGTSLMDSRLLLVWVILGLILLYAPFNLQRRFILGYYIPLVGLAVLGLNELGKHKKVIRRIAFGLSLPTNAFILALTIFGSLTHAPLFYLTQDEAAAMAWIQANSTQTALILASPEIGMFIPAETGRRVIYGHPYETPYAVLEKQSVEDFFSGRLTQFQAASFLTQQNVDLVFCGPHEQELAGSPTCPGTAGLTVVFTQGQVTLYAVNHPALVSSASWIRLPQVSSITASLPQSVLIGS